MKKVVLLSLIITGSGLVAELKSRQNNFGVISDMDFQMVKNFILLDENTREWLEPGSKCLSYSLYKQEFSTNFELISNCTGWEAVRITIEQHGELTYDYYVNHEYRKVNNDLVGSGLITSSFGLKTDSMSFMNFRTKLMEIKSALMSPDYIKRLMSFFKQKLAVTQPMKKITPSTLNVAITESTIEIMPADGNTPPYQLSISSLNSSDGVHGWNSQKHLLNLNMDSQYFVHLTTIYIEIKKELISRIR